MPKITLIDSGKYGRKCYLCDKTTDNLDEYICKDCKETVAWMTKVRKNYESKDSKFMDDIDYPKALMV